MAYSRELTQQIRDVLGPAGLDFVEVRMFGGLAFMVSGHFACSVHNDEILVRAGEGRADEFLAIPGVRFMEMGGRQMRGWYLVPNEHISGEASLARWVMIAVDFAKSLPPKKPLTRTQRPAFPKRSKMK